MNSLLPLPAAEQQKFNEYSQVRKKLESWDAIAAEYATKKAATPEQQEKFQATTLKAEMQMQKVQREIESRFPLDSEKLEKVYLARGGKELKHVISQRQSDEERVRIFVLLRPKLRACIEETVGYAPILNNPDLSPEDKKKCEEPLQQIGKKMEQLIQESTLSLEEAKRFEEVAVGWYAESIYSNLLKTMRTPEENKEKEELDDMMKMLQSTQAQLGKSRNTRSKPEEEIEMVYPPQSPRSQRMAFHEAIKGFGGALEGLKEISSKFKLPALSLSVDEPIDPTSSGMQPGLNT